MTGGNRNGEAVAGTGGASPRFATASAVTITPVAGPLVGRVRLPGSKSVTNRALLLAGLARGESRLDGALASDDTARMAEALRAMGVSVVQENGPEGATFRVVGTGRLAAPREPLFLGNAGTAMRFLTAAAALVEGTVVLDGDAHMRKRPIGPLTRALGDLGVVARDTDGKPPVTVEGRGGFGVKSSSAQGSGAQGFGATGSGAAHVRAGTTGAVNTRAAEPGPAGSGAADHRSASVTIDAGLSSQYVSAILMAAACGTAPIDVSLAGSDIGARGYVDLTLDVMRAFGARAEETGPASWRVHPGGYEARTYFVEPDASAATYLWAMERLTGGRIDLGVEPARMAQPDARAHAVIAAFPHLPPVIDGSQMQDAIPTLAALAAFNETPVRFVGIANLRVKECDRVAAMATELSRVRPGLAVEEGDDLLVTPDPGLAGGTVAALIETYSDHRIAMSMALVGLRVAGVTILDPGCTAKTYPRYWDDLAALGVGLAPD